jgi:hypothetical protein
VTKVDTLVKEIGQLPREDLSVLFAKIVHESSAALEALRQVVWDSEIIADSASGALDDLLKEARDEHSRGETKPL